MLAQNVLGRGLILADAGRCLPLPAFSSVGADATSFTSLPHGYKGLVDPVPNSQDAVRHRGGGTGGL